MKGERAEDDRGGGDRCMGGAGDGVVRGVAGGGANGCGAVATFLVRGKKFGFLLVDHHGDGMVTLCCRAAPKWLAAQVGSEPA